MSSRYLKNNTKAKKGISPVIATVILVAVAVVIAAALAGFSSSLFGSYSQSSQITVRAMSISAGADAGSVTIVNKGGSAETVVSVKAAGYADAAVDPLTATIPANGEQTVVFDTMGFVAADAGKTITVTVETQSGQTYTLSTIVQA